VTYLLRNQSEYGYIWIDWTTFNYPDGITWHNGRLYVADLMNQVIRRVYDGETSTLGGSGIQGNANGWNEHAEYNSPSSIAMSSDGNMLYIADSGNAAIRQLSLDGNTMTVTLSGGTHIIRQTHRYSPW
jgi:sugar lactone lactonase YvrE